MELYDQATDNMNLKKGKLFLDSPLVCARSPADADLPDRLPPVAHIAFLSDNTEPHLAGWNGSRNIVSPTSRTAPRVGKGGEFVRISCF